MGRTAVAVHPGYAHVCALLVRMPLAEGDSGWETCTMFQADPAPRVPLDAKPKPPQHISCLKAVAPYLTPFSKERALCVDPEPVK